MRSVFDRVHAEWPQLTGSVHVYALPALDPDMVAAWHGAITRAGVCAVQPYAWLHATIDRSPAFLGRTDPAQVDAFDQGLAAFAARTAPFTLPLAEPAIWTSAVVAAGPQRPEWADLTDGVRAVAAAAFPGQDVPDAPKTPHVSIGYGTHQVDDAPLVAELAAVAAKHPWSAGLVVDKLHLLSVHGDPDLGIFSWDVLAVHPLGG